MAPSGGQRLGADGNFQAQSGLPEDLLAGGVAGITDGTPQGGNGAQRPNLVGPLKVALQPNPGGARTIRI